MKLRDWWNKVTVEEEETDMTADREMIERAIARLQQRLRLVEERLRLIELRNKVNNGG